MLTPEGYKSRLVENNLMNICKPLEQFVLKDRNIAVKPGQLEAGLRVQPL